MRKILTVEDWVKMVSNAIKRGGKYQRGTEE